MGHLNRLSKASHDFVLNMSLPVRVTGVFGDARMISGSGSWASGRGLVGGCSKASINTVPGAIM